MLPNDKKAMIAGELDRSVREIERKISVSKYLIFKNDSQSSQSVTLTINTGYAHKSSILSFSL